MGLDRVLPAEALTGMWQSSGLAVGCMASHHHIIRAATFSLDPAKAPYQQGGLVASEGRAPYQLQLRIGLLGGGAAREGSSSTVPAPVAHRVQPLHSAGVAMQGGDRIMSQSLFWSLVQMLMTMRPTRLRSDWTD
jgi:hypothetical protein